MNAFIICVRKPVCYESSKLFFPFFGSRVLALNLITGNLNNLRVWSIKFCLLKKYQIIWSNSQKTFTIDQFSPSFHSLKLKRGKDSQRPLRIFLFRKKIILVVTAEKEFHNTSTLYTQRWLYNDISSFSNLKQVCFYVELLILTFCWSEWSVEFKYLTKFYMISVLEYWFKMLI